MSRPLRTKLDDVDRRLFRLLQTDARRSNVSLAKELGISEKTVRLRVERLVDQHELRFTAVLPRGAAAVSIVYLLKCLPGTRFGLADGLREREAVQDVLITNGSADLLLRAEFNDEAEALEFQLECLDREPRIIQQSACKIISSVLAREIESPSRPEIRRESMGDALLYSQSLNSVEEFVDWIGPTVARIFGASGTMVCEFEAEESLKARYMIWYNVPETYQSAVRSRIPTMENLGVVYRVVRTGQHVFLPDAAKSPILSVVKDLVVQAGIRSLLSVPIQDRDEPLGAVTLYFSNVIHLTDDYLSTVQGFVDQCGLRLARLREPV